MQVVFHLSSGDVDDWRHALGNVRNLLADDTADVDDVVLLVNGDAIRAVEAGSPVSTEVRALGETPVRCLGCRNSVSSRDMAATDLLANVDLVPSGVGELARLQDEGYAYLKVP
ncbi:DsrE family protein [Halobellus rubicundus]|uniref:DsrE family protein n=1 Tax=Halobellus rubicundus TaxID=2996466 RepID=A0ABD5MAV5_9EURY